MRRRVGTWIVASILAALGLAGTSPAFGAGFGIFEQGSRAEGMASAFTAQADDPSAMFYNAAGLAFQKDRDFMVGFTWIRGTTADFEGANPFPGVGARADQETLSKFPPHLYWVEPLNDRWTFGLGVNAPFGLAVEWKDKATFAGRFLSTRADLAAIDVNPNVAVKLSDHFSLGLGVIERFSRVKLNQYVPAQNPFTQTVDNVGFLDLSSGYGNDGLGFNLGVLYKSDGFLSWGLSYRSAITVDYSGDGFLTQIPTGNAQFDAAVAANLPFDRNLPVATSIDFPAIASLGVGFHLAQGVMLETDINWTGWSRFETLQIDFTDDDLPDATRQEQWNNAYNYRVGVSLDTAGGNQWRFGALYDETPQPEEAVSPLLPDNNRTGLSVGYGFKGSTLSWDLALTYLHLDKRTRAKSFQGESDFFGTYDNEAILLGISLGF